MNKKKCENCAEYRRCRDSYASWIFFIIGLIATIAVRAVTVLMHVNPVHGKIAWYIGIVGFLLFFIYKFKVSHARTELIKRAGLVDKIVDEKELTKEDYKLIGSLLCSVSSNKEKVNYFFIFALSAVALILAVYMDFVR